MTAPTAPTADALDFAEAPAQDPTVALHLARTRLARAQSDVDNVEAQIEAFAADLRADYAGVYDALEAAEVAVERADARMRSETVRKFHETGDRRAVPGASVSVHKKWVIDPARALAFAKEKGLFLKESVDAKALQKFVESQVPKSDLKDLGKEGSLTFEVEGLEVTVEADLRASVDSDLSTHLST